jgi:hypothetical protein
MEQKDSEIVARKYIIGVTKEMITKEQKQEIKRILDDILPVQSSRNYRYQEQLMESFTTLIEVK